MSGNGEFGRVEYIEKNPFSLLYFIFGWRDPEIPEFNYSEKCIWFDLEFFDPNSEYKWFMERMGVISSGEIIFEEIEVYTDQSNWEWIKFKVNGVSKNWKLERTNFIADHFIQSFSYLPDEFNTNGRYTYYNDGSQQFMIDYATEEEQINFITKTGLKREWLGEKGHFSDPKE